MIADFFTSDGRRHVHDAVVTAHLLWAINHYYGGATNMCATFRSPIRTKPEFVITPHPTEGAVEGYFTPKGSKLRVYFAYLPGNEELDSRDDFHPRQVFSDPNVLTLSHYIADVCHTHVLDQHEVGFGQPLLPGAGSLLSRWELYNSASIYDHLARGTIPQVTPINTARMQDRHYYHTVCLDGQPVGRRYNFITGID